MRTRLEKTKSKDSIRVCQRRMKRREKLTTIKTLRRSMEKSPRTHKTIHRTRRLKTTPNFWAWTLTLPSIKSSCTSPSRDLWSPSLSLGRPRETQMTLYFTTILKREKKLTNIHVTKATDSYTNKRGLNCSKSEDWKKFTIRKKEKTQTRALTMANKKSPLSIRWAAWTKVSTWSTLRT